MKIIKRLLRYFLNLCWFAPLLYLSKVSSVDTDVIGSYSFANEQQCNNLCWYRQLCSAYSFRVNHTASVSETVNCVLHTDSVPVNNISSLQNSERWLTNPVSNTDISNGCKTRPCGHTQMCVPTSMVSEGSSSVSGTTSSQLGPHTCLPFPAQCEEPPTVPHRVVQGSGRRQDDVVHVTCENGFMTSPDNLWVEMTCLVTSGWTAFAGECLQYEFHTFNTNKRFIQQLPRDLSDDSMMCVRGLMSGTGQFYIILRTGSSKATDSLRIVFRYQYRDQTRIVWNTLVNGTWSNLRHLADNPLLPGDTFNITAHVQSEHVQFVLNDDHVYNIPVATVSADGIEIKTLKWIAINHSHDDMMILTYVNLISAC